MCLALLLLELQVQFRRPWGTDTSVVFGHRAGRASLREADARAPCSSGQVSSASFAPAPPPPAGGAPCSQFSAPHPVSKPPGRSSGVTPEHPGTARTPTLGGPVRPPVSGNGPLLRPADIEGDLVLVPSFPSPSSFRPSAILSSVALERPQLVCVCVAHAESPVSPPRLSS